MTAATSPLRTSSLTPAGSDVRVNCTGWLCNWRRLHSLGNPNLRPRLEGQGSSDSQHQGFLVSAFGRLHSNACMICANAFFHPLCPHSRTFQCEPSQPVLEILLHPWPRAKLETPSRQSGGFINAVFSIQSTGFGPDTFLCKGEIDEFRYWVPCCRMSAHLKGSVFNIN